MRYINEIIIHATGNKASSTISVEDIRHDHMKRLGWQDIGYHYVISQDGKVHKGRPVSRPGAHCQGHNAHSIGVAYIGGILDDGTTGDTRTDAQRASMAKLCYQLCKKYRARIVGHNKYNAAKACPCFDVESEYGSMYHTIIKQTP